MSCCKDHKDKKSVRMESVHRAWFNEQTTHEMSNSIKTKAASLSGDSEYVLVADLQCDIILRTLGEDFHGKAKELGTYLSIPSGKLDEFRRNNMGDVKGMLIDVLNYWLETDPRKSWSKLAEAVEYCDHGVLAEKIRSTKDNGQP